MQPSWSAWQPSCWHTSACCSCIRVVGRKVFGTEHSQNCHTSSWSTRQQLLEVVQPKCTSLTRQGWKTVSWQCTHKHKTHPKRGPKQSVDRCSLSQNGSRRISYFFLFGTVPPRPPTRLNKNKTHPFRNNAPTHPSKHTLSETIPPPIHQNTPILKYTHPPKHTHSETIHPPTQQNTPVQKQSTHPPTKPKHTHWETILTHPPKQNTPIQKQSIHPPTKTHPFRNNPPTPKVNPNNQYKSTYQPTYQPANQKTHLMILMCSSISLMAEAKPPFLFFIVVGVSFDSRNTWESGIHDLQGTATHKRRC